MTAWYMSNVADFIETDPASIVGILSSAAAQDHFDTTPESIAAWQTTIVGLKGAAQTWTEKVPESTNWAVMLEYMVRRRRRRIDAVVLSHDLINLIEMKVGSDYFGRDARWQTEQYALDIRDFHEESRQKRIVPFLVAAESEDSVDLTAYAKQLQISDVACVNFDGLSTGLVEAYSILSSDQSEMIDHEAWNKSSYRPTPWIVEAAQTIYVNNDVREIQHSDSSNLDDTVNSVLELIDDCRRRNRHGIAFITGAPGSGKTLAGLQVVHDHRISDKNGEAAGVFLSGNRPLVEVIRKALAIDDRTTDGRRVTLAERERRTETFI
ncbi:MAG: hypothetical protein CL732_06245 [Chloroflexi bacterium]|nr:hypothetical protein [Chloroflexota bacterium]